MYNLFIGYVGPAGDENTIEVSPARFLEYTDSETQMRFKKLTSDAVREIKSYPALFMEEAYPEGAFVATITNITKTGLNYKVSFERDASIGVISPDAIEKMTLALDIEGFEFYRTHWAIKQSDLPSTLKEYKISSEISLISEIQQPENHPPPEGSIFNKDQVFIVHGHDVHAKNDAKSYVESCGLVSRSYYICKLAEVVRSSKKSTTTVM